MRVRAIVVLSVLAASCVLGSASSVSASVATEKRVRPLAVSNLALPSAPLREQTPTAPTRNGTPDVQALSALSPSTAYQTADGMTVYVSVSDSYVNDPAVFQTWVDFFGWLTHGPELNGLNLYVLTPDEMTAVCGQGSGACYFPSPGWGSMVVAGVTTNGVPVEQAIAHEYGHHIANHRLNPPWSASDWGPKRWASSLDVCANVAAGRLFPGAEPPDFQGYALNPGEGWAEAYRWLNETRAWAVDPTWWTPMGWDVVDPYFMPAAGTAALISREVVKPWSGSRKHVVRGRLRPRATQRWTYYPYDGQMTATITGSPGTLVSLRIGGRVVRGPARRVSRVICGSDPVTVVARSKQGGRFVLRVSDDEG